MDKGNLRLSVIVPVYNAGRYLHQCVDSILGQTYSQLEIILVDDGSTDSSGRICDEYGAADSRITVVHKPNEGLMMARRTGIEHAKGTYVTFVDADDWIERDAYSEMVKSADGCDIVVCGIYRYHDRNTVRAEMPGYADGIYDRQDILEQIVPNMLWKKEKNDWNLDPSLCTKLFKRELLLEEFEHAGNVTHYFGEDTAIIFPLMLRIRNMRVLSQCHYYHRQRKEGVIPSYIQDEYFFDATYRVYRYLRQEFTHLGYWDVMKNQLEHFYLNALERKRSCYQEARGKLCPIFPFEEIQRGSTVILYGAGKVGRKYMEQNEKYRFCSIIMWVDREYQNIRIPGYHIEDPEKIRNAAYDYVVIAIDIQEAAVKVKERLKEYGVLESRIVWHSIREINF